MDQEKKTSKKKILTYYLILSACILAIAVVTVTLIFTLNKPKTVNTASVDQSIGDNDGDNDDNTVVDTSTKYQFIYPVESVKTLNSFAFYQNSTLKNYYVHRGIDFSATSGTPVLACLDGVVESIKTGSILNGTQITLSHENGIKTIYTYVDANPELQVGDAVQRGDVIGTVADATGCEYRDGSHLHFEVYSNGKLTDPDTYLDGGVK